MFSTLTCLLLAYLIGSISSAILFSKLFKLADPRSYGSKNPGATNVLRSGNRLAAIGVLLFDVLKGIVPIVIARLVGEHGVIVGLTGVLAILGHMFPLYHRFKGGKGVATGFGVLIALYWQWAVVAAVIFLIVALSTRYVSLASISACIGTLIVSVFFGNGSYEIALILLTLLVVGRHYQNIQRLLEGKENKLFSKQKST